MHSGLNDWFVLCKLNISLPVTLSTLTGFVLYSGSLSYTTLYACAGVLLLAAASSTANHILEKDTDKLMPRTGNRPIPSGRISVNHAFFFVIIAGVSGAILLFKAGLIPMLLALFNLIFYALVYTPLKKVTAFAVIPGSLIGAIPPAIGWTAAGGHPLHLHIILVAFFFFIGQVPHFWLVVMRYGSDYEAAGLPSLSRFFTQAQLANLTLVWVAATAMAAIMLIIFKVITVWLLSIVIFLMVILLFTSFRQWFGVNKSPKPKNAFMAINLFYLGIMLTLIADAFVR